MKVEIFFRASRGEIVATRFYTLPSAVPVPLKIPRASAAQFTSWANFPKSHTFWYRLTEYCAGSGHARFSLCIESTDSLIREIVQFGQCEASYLEMKSIQSELVLFIRPAKRISLQYGK